MKPQGSSVKAFVAGLLGPKSARWLVLVVVLSLIVIAFGKPAYTRFERKDSDGWTKALIVEAQMKCASDKDAAQDFGRQLDTLTAFYETIISMLLGIIAVVAGIAFWTIKVVTKNEAEETAQAAAEKIMGGHDGFANKLRDAVSREVGNRLEEMQAKIEDLEETGVAQEVVQPTPQVKPRVRPKT